MFFSSGKSHADNGYSVYNEQCPNVQTKYPAFYLFGMSCVMFDDCGYGTGILFTVCGGAMKRAVRKAHEVALKKRGMAVYSDQLV